MQQKVSEGTLTVSGSNDVLTMALGPEHPGRVRAAGTGVSTLKYFNLPRQRRVKFEDKFEERLRTIVQEEQLKFEARTQQLVAAERENILNQVRQLLPNFDATMIKQSTPPFPIQGQEQSPKNPMSDKASCSGAIGVKAINFEEENNNAEQAGEEKMVS